MNNTIDIFIENSGISVDSVQNDSVQSEILVSLSRDTSVDVDNVAPSMTVDFGSLPQTEDLNIEALTNEEIDALLV